jgi:hypothetical protein
MGGKKANPRKALKRVQLIKQVRKTRSAGKIMSIGINILPQQSDLFRATFNKSFYLRTNLSQRAASLPPTPVGYDTIGTEIVTALDDSNESAG